MVELFVKGIRMYTEFVVIKVDCKEHKIRNLIGSAFGKGAKEKLENIAQITRVKLRRLKIAFARKWMTN